MSTYDINGAANAIVDIVGQCAALPHEEAVAAVRALLEQYGPPTPEEEGAWAELERQQHYREAP